MSRFLQNEITFKIGEWLLKRQLAKRDREVVTTNYQQAKTIGLVINALEPNMIDRLTKQLRVLKQLVKNPKIEIVAIKTEKQELIFSQKLTLTEVTNKDFNAFYLPTEKELKAFLETPFDILIDCSVQPHKLVTRVIALSKARFKVGLTDEQKLPYLDFSITEHQEEFKQDFLKHVNHYLKILNQTKHAA